ncbi:CHAT domain-containing protein [Streptomyces venezuelae]|uniref:CHAT domain-containing protein n=1 Tax=Streptomyces venezuelae TaxID=54571 RepID=A0A5P2CWG4_STRVZ|nr:CHAT domain-containing protein [Streptomyces venezuelae]
METQDEAAARRRDELAGRARDLVRRSEGARALPAAPECPPGPPAAERDALIEEMRRLLPELTDRLPEDAVLPAVLARLGALIGARWTEQREEADRKEAIALLRRARSGDLLDVPLRTAAAADLFILLVGRFGVRRELGMEAMQALVDASVPEQHGGPGLIEVLPELEQLAHEAAAGKREGLPPAMAEFLAFQTELHTALTTGDGAGLIRLLGRMDTLDQTLMGPMAQFVRPLMNMLPTSAEDLPEGGLRPPTQAEQQELLPMLGLMAELVQPGALSTEQISDLLRKAEAAAPGTGLQVSESLLALARTLLGGRTGDAVQYEEALRLLRKAAEEGQDEDFGWFLRGVLPGLLSGSAMTGGSRLDSAAAEELLRQSLAPGVGPLVAQEPPGRPGARDMLRANRYMLLISKVSQAADADDVPALEALIEDALDLLDELDAPTGPEATDGPDPADAQRLMPLFLLGYAHLALAKATSDTDALRSAAHHLDQAYLAAQAQPFARQLMDALGAPLLALTSSLDPQPERVAAAVERARASLLHTPVFADQRIHTRRGIAMALTLRYEAEGDPALLDEAVAELERARDELSSGTAQAASALYWNLAEGYATRAGRSAGPDLARAVSDARASLRATAADVLLQQGVQHGLEVARGGAARGLVAASWAVRADRPDEAVACLEAGRALVLGAAAVSATVPERLAALGEEELARQWREARPGAGGAGPSGLLTSLLAGSPDAPDLPSGLRRRALDLLRGQDDGQDGRVPGIAELRGAVARSGADALVYLLPGEEDEEGWALLLVPDREPLALPLPALSGRGRAPVAAYLEATAGRFSARRGMERWEAALDALCDWAGTGVVAPLLHELGLWERGLREAGLLPGPTAAPASDPVRLVFVACGNLGVVPWQAARLAVPDRWREAGAPATVRACEPVVLTYAASGREFLRAARTRRLPLDRGQALVCVPAGLDMAEDEVLAVHDAYYPQAALYGEFDTRAFEPPLPVGTPAEVLGLLGARDPGADPVAVVHLVCHGTAGADPGSSVLELGRAVGAGPGAGRLSVSELLDTPAEPAGAGRPLVVLSACETDLSTRDHDEALTVTTAFVHGLAADAVGSRWKVSDDASAVLMTVFHHHVAAGLAPADALRAAQRWMLAPAGDRPALPGLTPHLWRTAARPELSGPAFWGAFIHQGNPASHAGGAPHRGGTRRPVHHPREHHGEGDPAV